jgi:hypothetical protein
MMIDVCYVIVLYKLTWIIEIYSFLLVFMLVISIGCLVIYLTPIQTIIIIIVIRVINAAAIFVNYLVCRY